MLGNSLEPWYYHLKAKQPQSNNNTNKHRAMNISAIDYYTYTAALAVYCTRN